MTALFVALGAALGATLRYCLAHRFDEVHPRGTLLANSLGCLAVGLLSGIGVSGHVAALLAVGFCGALTTFSSFAVQAHVRGLQRGGAYVAVTLVLAMSLVTLGFVVGARFG